MREGQNEHLARLLAQHIEHLLPRGPRDRVVFLDVQPDLTLDHLPRGGSCAQPELRVDCRGQHLRFFQLFAFNESGFDLPRDRCHRNGLVRRRFEVEHRPRIDVRSIPMWQSASASAVAASAW